MHEKHLKHFECLSMVYEASRKCCNSATLLQRRSNGKNGHCNCNCTFTDTLNGCRESIWNWVHEKKNPFTCGITFGMPSHSYQSHHSKLCNNCQCSIGNSVQPHIRAHTHTINLTSKCHKKRSKWYQRLKFSVTICMYCNMSALLDCLLVHFKDSQYRVTVWLMGFRCLLYETLTGCGGM